MVFQLTKRLAFPDPHWGDPDGLLATCLSTALS